MAQVRVVNIEEGMPTVDQAIRRLTFELRTAKAHQIRVIKLIHGYGSSGTGGKLRIELRKYLDRQRQLGQVSGFVPGEQFTIFEADARNLLTACPELRSDRDLERHNNGITYVLLK